MAVAVVVVVAWSWRGRGRGRRRCWSRSRGGGVVGGVFQFVFLPSQRVWGHPWESGRVGEKGFG